MLRVEDTFWIRGWRTERGRDEERKKERKKERKEGIEGSSEWSGEGGNPVYSICGENTGAEAGRIELEQGRKLKVPHVVVSDSHARNLISYKSCCSVTHRP